MTQRFRVYGSRASRNSIMTENRKDISFNMASDVRFTNVLCRRPLSLMTLTQNADRLGVELRILIHIYVCVFFWKYT